MEAPALLRACILAAGNGINAPNKINIDYVVEGNEEADGTGWSWSLRAEKEPASQRTGEPRGPLALQGPGSDPEVPVQPRMAPLFGRSNHISFHSELHEPLLFQMNHLFNKVKNMHFKMKSNLH